ncbi:hypothetical protein IEQ34_021602 [Dendrobium chrysotoxum]|uniref:Uncharacterized protein n=1 Tax=Dendrobium chrysotoxum TaxID=161865 RepID=A0AAV7G439_DENCH|nr:hypothetical protein IEQ34_021602 [Dendrobium chrysotoxum]
MEVEKTVADRSRQTTEVGASEVRRIVDRRKSVIGGERATCRYLSLHSLCPIGHAFPLLPFDFFVTSVGVQIARVASSAPSWLFDFAPSTTFPSCRIGSYDFLIGSNNESSLAVKVDRNPSYWGV